MASKKQKSWRKVRKKWNSLNYQFEEQTGQPLKVLFGGNEKKGMRAVEQGVLSEITKKDIEDLKAWFRHNQQKQNHINAHSSFYECSQLRLKSWEVDGIGHSNGGGKRYQDARTTKEIKARIHNIK